MPVDRKQAAAVLDEIARLMELRGENPFKCRAFESAARAIERADAELEELVASDALTSIRGIGKSTAEQITSLVREGYSPLLEELQSALPAELRRLMQIPGLGPKKLRVIHESLGVASIADLEHAIQANRLRDLPGFGQKSQDALLHSIESFHAFEGRFLLPAAWEAAAAYMAVNGSRDSRLEIAGELRRQMETLTEVLFVAESREGPARQETARTVHAGVPVRVLACPPESFEARWLWESCSLDHRLSLEKRAGERGLSFSGEGLRRGETLLPLDESGIYRMLGLEPVHPLLREGPAGVAAHPTAIAGPESIRGIFHVHTTDSDGTATISQMVAEAERMGYAWVGISDHSKAASYANGLAPERLRAQRRAIDELQKQHARIRIFHGTESDILGDGSLDYDDDVLRELDFVVASIHSRMRMSRDAMTARIERAIRHPATTHWGHPTGRLLLERDPYDCDIEHLLHVCAEEGVSVEFNANPQRLDLDWRWIPRALELGVKLSVNPDAHSLSGLADARLTVGTAAKGGASAGDLLNSLSVDGISDWLRAVHRRWDRGVK
jgi:DNA polymerase (family X)